MNEKKMHFQVNQTNISDEHERNYFTANRIWSEYLTKTFSIKKTYATMMSGRW